MSTNPQILTEVDRLKLIRSYIERGGFSPKYMDGCKRCFLGAWDEVVNRTELIWQNRDEYNRWSDVMVKFSEYLDSRFGVENFSESVLRRKEVDTEKALEMLDSAISEWDSYEFKTKLRFWNP